MKSAASFTENRRFSRGAGITRTLAGLLGLVLFTAAASAEPSVYVVNLNQQFGTVDLATGAFHPIGAPTPDGLSNLVWWKDGSLLSLATSGNNAGSLVKINPANGEETLIGPTGLGFNAFDLGEVRGKLYVTDFSNNIYSVDPETGAATFIRPTGMPPDPTVPFTINSNGTLNLCDETLYGIRGKFYATFDSLDIDPNPGDANYLGVNVHVSPNVYEIDPETGVATPIAPTALGLGATVEVDGKVYAFTAVVTAFVDGFPQAYNQLLTLNLETGETQFVTNVDPTVGPIFGAAPVRRRWAEER